MPRPDTSSYRHPHAIVVIALLMAVALGGTATISQAQTTSTTSSVVASSTSVPPTVFGAGLDIRFAQIDGSLSQVQVTGGQFTQVTIQNTGPAVGATQIVVKFGSAPSVIQSVTESGQAVGVVDQKTSSWYHTVPSIGEGRSITYVVNWYAGCAGRWPLAARVGERRVSTVVTYAGQSLQGCPPDETASPAPPSYYDLVWPPSAGAPTTPSTTLTPSSALPTAPTLPTTVPPGGVATTIPGNSSTTTIAKPVTTRRPTTRRATKPTTTVEIVCKTVSGRRYCGPKSTAIKPGAQKPREVKPTTTRKRKK